MSKSVVFSLDTLEFDFNNTIKTKIIDKGDGKIDISGSLSCDISTNNIILNDSFQEFNNVVSGNLSQLQSIQNKIKYLKSLVNFPPEPEPEPEPEP